MGIGNAENVLSTIKIDSSIYQSAFDKLSSGKVKTYSNQMARANLSLLMDRPDEALAFFESACSSAPRSSSRDMREALEGIARAIRAQQRTVGSANAFVLSVRKEASLALPAVAAGNLEKYREVAMETILAPVAAMEVPALEDERAAQETNSKQTRSNVTISADFEMGSRFRLQAVHPTRFKLILTPQLPTLCDWFCFRVDGARGQTIRIDLATDQASLDRWWTLNPVWCDAENYEKPDMPSKNEGGRMKDEQSPIPDTSGQSWHYISGAWRSDAQTFSFVHRYESDQVYIAMRVPYPPSQNEKFLRELASTNKSLDLIEIGRSREKQPLLMAKIGAGDEKTKPCVLLYAGEHADEPDGMWAARGAVEFLAGDTPEAKQLRDRCTFLIIPQLDPGGSYFAIHEGINTTFLTGIKTPESIAYANWFHHWVDEGKRLDLVLDLHNMQSMEMGHVQCWLMEGVGERGELSMLVHRSVIDAVLSKDFEMIGTPTQRGWSPDRLGGWLARRCGPLCLLYELNGQAPDRHLTLGELKELGATLVKAGGDFFKSADGVRLISNVDARRQERLARWTAHGDVPRDLDAIQAEAAVSPGAGIGEGNSSGTKIEKWVP